MFTPRPFRAPALLGLTAVLTACGTQSSTSGETLRFLTSSLPAAATGEPYSQEVVITAGARPYSARLLRGALPSGIRLDGQRLSGTPVADAKTSTFTLEVSDANLSVVSREYTLEVRPVPPASLEWRRPQTEVRGEIQVPFVLRSPKNVAALRASIPLPAGVSFVRLEPRDGRPLLVSSVEGNVLRVDAAFVERFGTNREATVFVAVLKSEAGVRIEGTVGYDLRAEGRSLVPEVAPSFSAATGTPTGTPTGTATGAATGTVTGTVTGTATATVTSTVTSTVTGTATPASPGSEPVGPGSGTATGTATSTATGSGR